MNLDDMPTQKCLSPEAQFDDLYNGRIKRYRESLTALSLAICRQIADLDQDGGNAVLIDEHDMIVMTSQCRNLLTELILLRHINRIMVQAPKLDILPVSDEIPF